MFWLVSKDEVQWDIQWECQPIQGSRVTHCVDGYSPEDPCALRLRTLSCFCDPCLSGQWRRCKSKQYIEEWKYISIVPVQVVDNEDSEEDKGAIKDDSIMAIITMS